MALSVENINNLQRTLANPFELETTENILQRIPIAHETCPLIYFLTAECVSGLLWASTTAVISARLLTAYQTNSSDNARTAYASLVAPLSLTKRMCHGPVQIVIGST